MLSRITKQLLKKPLHAIAALLIIILALTAAGTQVAIDPSFSSLISSEGEYNTNARILENAYGSNSGFEIVYLIDEQATTAQRPDTLSKELLNDSAQTLTALLDESQYVTSIGELEISSSQRQAKIAVGIFEPNNPQGGILVKEELQALTQLTPTPPGVNLEVTGFPVILERVNTLLISDNLNTIAITALLVFLVLLWYFRNFKLALISVLSPIGSLAMLAGVMALLNINITLTLAAVGVIVVGLGADYSIHLITTYVRHLREGQKPKQAILQSLDELELALTASYLTTAAGFAALMIGVSPSSQAQGAVLTIAITLIYTSTMLLLPLLLFTLQKTPPSGGREAISFIDSTYTKLAKLQTNKPKTVLATLAVITVVLLVGATQVGFSTSNSNWIPDDDPVAVTFSEITTAFGDEQTVTILVQSTRGDLRSVSTARDVQLLEEKIRGIPGVTRVQSVFTNQPLQEARLEELPAQAFNKDYTLTTISVVVEGLIVDESGESTLLGELQDIQESTPVHQAKTSIFGDLVRFSELGESLQADAAQTTLAGLALVFVIAALIYTSFAVGAIALTPIIVAVLWAVGLMGFFNIPFTSLSTGIVSLVLGIGVDFSIHLVNAIRNARKKTADLQEAIQEALHTTGGAILLSSITTFMGFLALTFATLLGTQRLGWSLALSILSVFLVSILLVPTIVVLRERVLKRST